MRAFAVLGVCSLVTSSLTLAANGLPETRVVGWGDNVACQATGVPPVRTLNQPLNSTGMVSIAGLPLKNVSQVAAGYGSSLALKTDGTVFAWGANLLGEGWGLETPPHGSGTGGQVKVHGVILSNVMSVATGRTHSLALRADGTVIGWGDDRLGQISVPATLSSVTAIAAAGNHSLALKNDGTVVLWGEGNRFPDGLSNVVAISASPSTEGRDLALRSDGTVFGWYLHGAQEDVVFREKGVPASAMIIPMRSPKDLTNAAAVAAGYDHSLALRSDGTVTAWGRNYLGQATGAAKLESRGFRYDEGLVTLSGHVLSNVVAISAGCGFSVALKEDGTVVGWGAMNQGALPMSVPEGLTNVVAISAGEGYCLVLTTNTNGLTSDKAGGP